MWEAAENGDVVRHNELLSHYSFGLRKRHRKYLERLPKEKAEKLCHDIDAEYGSNDVTDYFHLLQFHNN